MVIPPSPLTTRESFVLHGISVQLFYLITKAQIPLRWLITKTSPQRKSQTQIRFVFVDTNGDKSWNHKVSMQVMDKNNLGMLRCLRQCPWQVCDKPVCVILLEFSPLQCTRKVSDKVRGHQSWQTFMICVCAKVTDFVAESQTDFVAKSAWWNLGLKWIMWNLLSDLLSPPRITHYSV